MCFYLVSVSLLVVNKVINFISLRHSRYEVSLLDLHVVQNLINLHVSRLKVGSSLNQRLSKLLTGLFVRPVAHVSLPKTENFTDQVVLEEFHRGQDIEHRALLHPIRQAQEFSRSSCIYALFASFLVEDLNNTLGRYCEVLLLERFFIVNYDEIVGTELGGSNLLAVAV